MRQGFYIVVLLVALAGQVSGAVETLGIPLIAAIPAVSALELGGIVVLANADVRRRLGERAVASRLLSVAIAVAASTFNWLAHADHLLGGFFAGMSALGYLVWVMHTENQRRDRLRITGDLPPTTPAYELVGHWLRHPLLTSRAKTLAKEDPQLGLYDSLAFARDDIKREGRQSAIAKVLHRKIRAAVDPKTADIALAVYDLDEIAIRLTRHADYDGLSALIAVDLDPARLAGAADEALDENELARLLDGRLTGDAPVSPAPAGAAGDDDTMIVPGSGPRSSTNRSKIVRPETAAGPGDAPKIVPASSEGDAATTPHIGPRSVRRGDATTESPATRAAALLPHAISAAEQLHTAGRPVNRDAIATTMRSNGVPVSNADAGTLMAVMKGRPQGRADRRGARRTNSVKKARARSGG
jgi:hypothetical protein